MGKTPTVTWTDRSKNLEKYPGLGVCQLQAFAGISGHLSQHKAHGGHLLNTSWTDGVSMGGRGCLPPSSLLYLSLQALTCFATLRTLAVPHEFLFFALDSSTGSFYLTFSVFCSNMFCVFLVNMLWARSWLMIGGR